MIENLCYEYKISTTELVPDGRDFEMRKFISKSNILQDVEDEFRMYFRKKFSPYAVLSSFDIISFEVCYTS